MSLKYDIFVSGGGSITPETLENRLVIAISSRALFNLEESNRGFEEDGLERYIEYQIEHEDEPLLPGVAFPLIRRLLNLKDPESGEYAVEVILASKNDAPIQASRYLIPLSIII